MNKTTSKVTKSIAITTLATLCLFTFTSPTYAGKKSKSKVQEQARLDTAPEAASAASADSKDTKSKKKNKRKAVVSNPDSEAAAASASSSACAASAEIVPRNTKQRLAPVSDLQNTFLGVKTPSKSNIVKEMVFVTPHSKDLQNSIYLFHTLNPEIFSDLKIDLHGKKLTRDEFLDVLKPFEEKVEALKEKATLLTEINLPSLELLEACKTGSSAAAQNEELLRFFTQMHSKIEASKPRLLFPRYIGQSKTSEVNPDRKLIDRIKEHMASTNAVKKPSHSKFHTSLGDHAAQFSSDPTQIPVQVLVHNVNISQIGLFEAHFIKLFDSLKENGWNSKADGMTKYEQFLSDEGIQMQDLDLAFPPLEQTTL